MKRIVFLLLVLMIVPVRARSDFWIQMPEIDPVPGAPGSGSPLLKALYGIKGGEKSNEFVKYVSGGAGRLDTGESDDNAGPKIMRDIIFNWPEYEGPPPVVWDLKEHYMIHKATTVADESSKGKTDEERLAQIDLERDMLIMSAWYRKYTRGPMKLHGAVIKASPVPLINQRDMATRMLLQGRGGIRLALVLFESSAGSLKPKKYDTGLQVLRDMFGVNYGRELEKWNSKAITPWVQGTLKLDHDWPKFMSEMVHKGIKPGYLRDIIKDENVPETVRDWAIILSGVTRRRECSGELQKIFFKADGDRRELIAVAMLKIADPDSDKFLKKAVKVLPKHAKRIGIMARAAVNPKMQKALIGIADKAFGYFEIKEGEVECLRYFRRYDLVHLMARSDVGNVRQNLWKRIYRFKILDSRWAHVKINKKEDDSTVMPPRQKGGTSHLMARAMLELKIGGKYLPAREIQAGLEELIGVAFNEVKIPGKNNVVKDRRLIGSPLTMACLCRLHGLDSKKAINVMKYILKTDAQQTNKWDEKIIEVCRELTKQ